MTFKGDFPGYKVVTISQKGFRVQCRTCYVARKSGWGHPHAVVPTIPAIRTWIAEHEHGFATGDEAREECSRMARVRSQCGASMHGRGNAPDRPPAGTRHIADAGSAACSPGYREEWKP